MHFNLGPCHKPRASIEEIGTNVANLNDKDKIIGNSEQMQLTNMRASGAPSQRRGDPLASIFVSWICEELLIIGLCQ